MKIGIFVAAHDGLQSILTGVGIVVNSFVESFDQIKNKSPFLMNNEVEIVCFAPYIDKSSNDYHPEIRQSTLAVCKRNNGSLIELDTLSDGRSQQSIWGGPSQWRSASLSLAKEIKSLEGKYDKIYLFAHDTIFSLVRYYLKDSDKLNIVWMPHSLGRVFEKEHADNERLIIEEDAIRSLSNTRGDFIGYIGDFFKEVLRNEYGVSKDKLIPFINGLYLNSQRYHVSLKEDKIISKYRIPKDKRIIFSWGRCVPQKGFDIILPAYKRFLKNYRDYHLVLLMPTETSDKKYISIIKKELADLPSGSVTSIFKFDPNLPYVLLKNKNTDMLIFASRFEGNPIAPIETLAFSKEAKILYSNIPPLNNLLNKNKGTIQFELNSGSLFKAMLKAHGLKQIINRKPKNSITETYVQGFSFLFHNRQ